MSKIKDEEIKLTEEDLKTIEVVEADDEDVTDEIETEDAVILAKTRPSKYHVSQNKKPGNLYYKKWRIRKEGSKKTIKFFDRQIDAIEHAKRLATISQTSVVIHGLKGSIKSVMNMKEKPIKEKVVVEKRQRAVVQKYHITREMDPTNKNYKKWRLRKEGSTKTIKYFDYQKEAIAHSEKLNVSTGRAVAIHKKKGAIRKHIPKKTT